MKNNYTLFGLSFVLFFSCGKLDKPEQIPSYIYIDKFELTTTSTQGTARHDIVDAWVYVNDQAVAVVELPSLVPILSEGNQKITIAPGIKNDGISQSRTKYPFYEEYITYDINLERGKVDSLVGANSPSTVYKPSTDIDIWNENFDDATINFVAATNSDAGISFVSNPSLVYEGTGCGMIELTSVMNFAEIITSQTFDLPMNGKAVYVEIHYNTNNSMAVGIQAIYGTEIKDIANTVLRKTDGEWKKMYVNLTDLVSQQNPTSQFKFTVQISKEDGVTTVQNYIDNFKVVYDK